MDSCPDLKKCPPGHFTFGLATKSEWYQDVLRLIEVLWCHQIQFKLAMMSLGEQIVQCYDVLSCVGVK